MAGSIAPVRPDPVPVRVPEPTVGGAPQPPAPRGGLRRGFAALRHRNYRVYWIGQIVSLIGTWMQSVTQPWLVLELGGSPLQLGLVLALQFAPATVFAPLGGVLADRVDKRRALMATQVLGMFEALALFSLTVTGTVEIWHIMALAAVLGLVNAVDMPVRQAFAAEMVPREDLVNAIALNSMSFNLARVVGPAVAGVTLVVFGIAFNFGLNAISYLAVLAGLWLMNPRRLNRPEQPDTYPPVLESLREGVTYAVRTPLVLWPLVLLAGIATFGMNFQTLLPLFARGTLGLDAGGYGALFATMGAGSLAGSLILAFLGARRPLVGLILGGGAGFIVLVIALGLSRDLPLVFPLVAGAGLAAMLMINTINVIVQHNVPNELRGRVMALYVTVFAGTAPIGGVFAGIVAELLGAPAGFVLGASIAVIFLALVAWKLGTRPPMIAVAPGRSGVPTLRVVRDDD
jgi:MFS family permease